jgi:hypothetical protein
MLGGLPRALLLASADRKARGLSLATGRGNASTSDEHRTRSRSDVERNAEVAPDKRIEWPGQALQTAREPLAPSGG